MPNKPTAVKVSFQAHSQIEHLKEPEFFVYCEPGQVEKWRSDPSMALVDVVQAFTIFECDTKATHGVGGKPSKQALFNAFGTEDETAIVTRILKEGKIQPVTAATSSAKGYNNSH